MATRIGTVKEAALQALQARKAIKNGDFSPFIPALAFALAKDCLFDFLADIPIAGLIPWFFSLFITVYLFVFLFGKGTWRIRVVIALLEFLDAIPFIGNIPLSTICVLYVYHKAKKKADQAAKELPVLEAQMSNKERIQEYQRAQAEAAAEEAEQSVQAANDASFGRNLSRKVI